MILAFIAFATTVILYANRVKIYRARRMKDWSTSRGEEWLNTHYRYKLDNKEFQYRPHFYITSKHVQRYNDFIKFNKLYKIENQKFKNIIKSNMPQPTKINVDEIEEWTKNNCVGISEVYMLDRIIQFLKDKWLLEPTK